MKHWRKVPFCVVLIKHLNDKGTAVKWNLLEVLVDFVRIGLVYRKYEI